MLVGHVTGKKDTINVEEPLKSFKIICTNEANIGLDFIFTFSLIISHVMQSRNVIWPEWDQVEVQNPDQSFYTPSRGL